MNQPLPVKFKLTLNLLSRHFNHQIKHRSFYKFKKFNIFLIRDTKKTCISNSKD